MIIDLPKRDPPRGGGRSAASIRVRATRPTSHENTGARSASGKANASSWAHSISGGRNRWQQGWDAVAIHDAVVISIIEMIAGLKR